MPEVSIITAVHNCVELTKAYVDSLIEHTTGIDWELILVDDASSDETSEYFEELKQNPRIQIVTNSTNQGFSKSNNIGASQATASTLAFLNNDLLLTQNWLEPMIGALDSCKQPGIIGNVQVNPNTGLLDHAGVFFGLDGMPRQARKNRKKPPQTPILEWYAVTAACMVIRKDVFDAADGFSERYRNGFEDIDLCVRLKQKGFNHYVTNQSLVYHCVSASPGRHKHNDANSNTFESSWTHITKDWGTHDWAPEYIERYRHQWWKFNLNKWLNANWQLLKDLRRTQLIYRK